MSRFTRTELGETSTGCCAVVGTEIAIAACSHCDLFTRHHSASYSWHDNSDALAIELASMESMESMAAQATMRINAAPHLIVTSTPLIKSSVFGAKAHDLPCTRCAVNSPGEARSMVPGFCATGYSPQVRRLRRALWWERRGLVGHDSLYRSNLGVTSSGRGYSW
jgi:hypothetical protein